VPEPRFGVDNIDQLRAYQQMRDPLQPLHEEQLQRMYEIDRMFICLRDFLREHLKA
jgi:hypothetical protein